MTESDANRYDFVNILDLQSRQAQEKPTEDKPPKKERTSKQKKGFYIEPPKPLPKRLHSKGIRIIYLALLRH